MLVCILFFIDVKRAFFKNYRKWISKPVICLVLHLCGTLDCCPVFSPQRKLLFLLLSSLLAHKSLVSGDSIRKLKLSLESSSLQLLLSSLSPALSYSVSRALFFPHLKLGRRSEWRI